MNGHFEPEIRSGVEFESINPAYNAVFKTNQLSLGVVLPLESYAVGRIPTMEEQVDRVELAEKLGFSALWLRDVPFNVPSFGDVGQIYDPFVYLGYLAARTSRIALGVASVILPLRHPAHVAKAAASADVLSGGRIILGVASGDRPEEYPALNVPFWERGALFRQSFEYIDQMWEDSPAFENHFGSPDGGMDMLPKPFAGKLPILITGGSQQHPDWISQHGDGWITYPRSIPVQARLVSEWRRRVEAAGRSPSPAMQSLYIDLMKDADAAPQPIHLGFRLGINPLLEYLQSLREIGINHVALNLRFNQADFEQTLQRLAEDVLPAFQNKVDSNE